MTSDLSNDWQKRDPTARGKNMKSLQECAFTGDNEAFASPLVIDDFDDGYNSEEPPMVILKNL